MSLQARIEALEKELQILSRDVAEDEQARQKLLGVTQQATAMLEIPPDIIWKLLFQPHLNACIRTAIEMGLFDALNTSQSAKTATEPASITGGDKLLIVRVLRPLAATHMVIETGYETYVAGPVPKAFAIPALLGGFKFMTQWFEIFPTEELLFEGSKAETENSALLVDVAGGNGYDIQTFKNRFPNHPGRLVLQDLPSVIDDIKELHPDIVRKKYDFFTEQPIKGARAYYFRSICHDWSDEKCREILGNTVAAMEPGYSKILINDWVLPDSGSPLLPALLDIQMLAVFSSMERTQPQWKELLGSVGLEIVKFHTIGKETEGLIEAVRKL